MLKSFKNILSIDPFRPAFRLFFLAGPIYAVVAITIWLESIHDTKLIADSKHSVSWHIHEMLYGFVGVVITGYVFTTISRSGSNKTNIVILFLVWITGRIVMNYFYYIWPTIVVGTIDTLFPILIASFVIRDLIISGKKNYIMLMPILFIFPVVNIVFHVGDIETVKISSLMFLNHMIILMITIIGGHLIPSLTLSWLRTIHSEKLPTSNNIIEVGVILSTIITAFFDVLLPNTYWVCLAGFITAFFHFLRLWGWRSFMVLKNFSLLVIHLAYAWIVIGYLLLAVSYSVDWINHSSAMHVLNIGTIGTMILAVMARLSIRFSNKIVTVTTNVAFILIFLAVIFRLFGSVFIEGYIGFINLSGLFWVMAFISFLVGYVMSIYYISKFKNNRDT